MADDSSFVADITRMHAEIGLFREVLSAVYDVAEAAIAKLDDPTIALNHLRTLICATARLDGGWYLPLSARCDTSS